ncbi:YdcF family protein [Guggenheimella bovis]
MYFFSLPICIILALYVSIQIESVKTEEIPEVSGVIILGAKLNGKTPSPTLVRRLEKALQYLLDHPDKKVIVSGGKGSDEKQSEAQAMADWLVKRGISNSRIYLEDVSISTHLNIEKSKYIWERHFSGNRILIVTSDYHALRAKLIATRYGFEAFVLKAKTPRASRFKPMVREVFALMKTILFDFPKKE